MKNKHLRTLTEGALLIAIATVLSLLKIDMPMGGGLTICSMLPLVIFAFRHGTPAGILTAFTYSALQMVLGLDNVAYGQTSMQVFLIIALDYIVPYTFIGLAGIFAGRKQVEGEDASVKSTCKALVFGIVFSFTLRFLCHLYTGAMIWDLLWPNEYGMTPWIYSVCYNGSYMILEIIITSVVAVILCKNQPKIFKRQ